MTSNPQTMISKEDAIKLELSKAKRCDSIILNNFIDSNARRKTAFMNKGDHSIIETTII